MKNVMFKRIISLVLCLCMVLGYVPAQVFAAETQVTDLKISGVTVVEDGEIKTASGTGWTYSSGGVLNLKYASISEVYATGGSLMVNILKDSTISGFDPFYMDNCDVTFNVAEEESLTISCSRGQSAVYLSNNSDVYFTGKGEVTLKGSGVTGAIDGIGNIYIDGVTMTMKNSSATASARYVIGHGKNVYIGETAAANVTVTSHSDDTGAFGESTVSVKNGSVLTVNAPSGYGFGGTGGAALKVSGSTVTVTADNGVFGSGTLTLAENSLVAKGSTSADGSNAAFYNQSAHWDYKYLNVHPGYAITIDGNIQGATVVANTTAADAGDSVTLTVTPKTARTLTSLTVGGNEVLASVQENQNGTYTYTFTMPSRDVAVSAALKVDPEKCPHEMYVDGACADCGTACGHTYVDGICQSCAALAAVKVTVGGTATSYYSSLTEAMTVVPTDGTQAKLTLLADEATQMTVAEGMDLILEGGNYGITSARDQAITVETGGVLTVNSGTYHTGAGPYGSDSAIRNAGTLTINGGTFSGDDYGLSNGGTLTITGGTFTGQKNDGIDQWGDSDVFISGGIITGSGFGIYNRGTSNVTVSGGKITGTTALYNSSTGCFTVTGGEMIGTSYGLNNNNGWFQITGGSITGKSNGIIINGTNGTMCRISGGTISGETGVALNNSCGTGNILLGGGIYLGGLSKKNTGGPIGYMLCTGCNYYYYAKDTGTIGEKFPYSLRVVNAYDDLIVVCSHTHWYQGKCSGCGMVCTHETYSDGVCTLCKAACDHSYDNGFCSACGGYQPALDTNSDGYYEIDNAGKLYWFAAVVNGGYGATAQNLAANAILTEHITVNTGTISASSTGVRVWTPLGGYADDIGNVVGYTGDFNGNGKTVSGLYCSLDRDNVGFVGVLGEGGKIRDLTLVNSFFSGNRFVGGMAGASSGTISGCTNSVAVTGTQEQVGGIAGVLGNKGSISDCSNTGSITMPSFSKAKYAGGIAGISNGTITDCTNSAEVSAPNRAGGIAGNSYGTITGCTNTGTVTATNTNGESEAGGIAAFTGTGSISNCSNSGTVTSSGYSGAGGIVGQNGYNGSVSITGCSNSGSVSTSSGAAGGIVAWNKAGTISNCYNTANLESSGSVAGIAVDNYGEITGCSNRGNIKATTACGGIAYANFGTVKLSYNTGNIEGNQYGIGGIVGENQKTVTGCYNIGTVTGKSSATNLSWANGVGGIVGATGTTSTSASVTWCYNYGAVTGTSVQSVGAIIGCNTAGSTANCWYLKGTASVGVGSSTGQTPSGGTTTGTGSATGLTAAQFSSGELWFLLTNGANPTGSVWGQKLGTDPYPVFSSDTVYKVFDCQGTFTGQYSNTQKTAGHNYVDGVCENCGTPCSHSFQSGVCSICGLVCPHETYSGGACTLCKERCLHEEFGADNKCTECGMAAAATVTVGSTTTYHLTVDKAMEKIPTDGTEATLTLLKDYTGFIRIAEGMNVVLSGGDYGIKPTNGDAISVSGGTLKVVSGTVKGNNGIYIASGDVTVTGGSVSGSNCGIHNNYGGSVTVTGGSITSTSTTGTAIYNGTAGTAEITGGTIYTQGNSSRGIENWGTLTVSGGTVKGYMRGIQNYGTVSVSGGAVSGTSTNCDGIYHDGDSTTVTVSGTAKVSGANSGIRILSSGKVSVTGGSVVGDLCGITNLSSGTILVSGGKVEATDTIGKGIYNDYEYGSVIVSGGTVSGAAYALYNRFGGTKVKLSGGIFLGGIYASSGSTVYMPKVSDLLAEGYKYAKYDPSTGVGEDIILSSKLQTAEDLVVICAHTKLAYSLVDNTIIAACGNEACSEYNKTIGSYTLVAENVPYTGEPHGAKIIATGIYENVALPEILYAQNGVALSGAPSEIGKYTVSVTVGELTLSGEYEITAATPVYTWNTPVQTRTYTGKTVEIEAPVFTRQEGSDTFGGTFTYAYTGTTAGGEAVSGQGLPTNAGEYTVTASAEAWGSYAAAEVPGAMTLTIEKAPLTVTAKALGRCVYGGTAPSHTVSYSDFVMGEDASVLEGTLTVFCDYDVTDPEKRNAGQYDIIPGGVTSDNYEIEFKKGILTVEPLEVTVRIDDQSVEYGEFGVMPHQYTFTLQEALPYGDTIEDVQPIISVTSDYTQGMAANQTLELKADSFRDNSGNYELKEVLPGELTVTPRKVRAVMTGSVTKAYDGTDAVPANNEIILELTNTLSRDNVSVTAELTYGQKTPGTGITVHAKALKLTGADFENYQLMNTSLSGSLGEITKAPLTVKAAAEGQIFYGGAAPDYTVSYSGFVPGEDASVLEGELTFSCDYDPARAGKRNAGSYAIIPGGLTSDNYDITFARGTLQVKPLPVTVRINNKTVTYGDTGVGQHSFTLFETLPYGESLEAVKASISVSSGYVQGAAAGTQFDLKANVFSDGSGNYQLTKVLPGKLTVIPRKVSVSLGGSVTKAYDGTTTVPEKNDLKLILTNILENDVVSATGSFGYGQKTVGEKITVTAENIKLTGTHAGNYTLTGTTASAKVGKITKATPVLGKVTAKELADTTDISKVVITAEGGIPGTFSVNPGQTLKEGNNSVSYTFIPKDGANYQTVTGAVTVTVKKTVCDGGKNCPLQRFTDVNSSHWAHHGMDFAVNNGLMNGTGTGKTFEPNTNMSRAMLVTVLWRYSGSPDAPDCSFPDVKKTDWFYKAVAWAAAEGVVNGMGDGSFAPNGDVTREMLATILCRYADMIGVDTSARASIASFPDEEKVSGWSYNYMKWAVAEGIISGAVKDGKTVLAPKDSANRAVVATIMMRFIQSFEN